MPDEEFVKLRFWLDAEFAIVHAWMAIILAFVAHSKWITIAVIVYVIFSILYSGSRIKYVESKHRGFLRIPRR